MSLTSSQTSKVEKQASHVDENHQFYKEKSIQESDSQNLTGTVLNDQVKLH